MLKNKALFMIGMGAMLSACASAPGFHAPVNVPIPGFDAVVFELEAIGPQRAQQALESSAQMGQLIANMQVRAEIAVLADKTGYIHDSRLQQRLQRDREVALQASVPRLYAASLALPDLATRARAYYDAHLEDFVPPEQVRVAQIMLKAPSAEARARRMPDMQKVLAQLQAGAEFGDLAERYSEDGSRYIRGDLGEVARGKTVPAFEDAAFALTEPGQLSDIVESQFGLHIIQMLEPAQTEPMAFEDVREQIQQKLLREYREAETSKWLEQQLAKPSVDDAVVDEYLAALRARFGMDEAAEDASDASAATLP